MRPQSPPSSSSSGTPSSHASIGGQLVAFGLVGGMGAICYVGLSVLLIGLETGLPDWVSGALAYGLLILPVYLAHRRYSFRAPTPHHIALPRYVAVQGFALVLAAGLSFICYNVLQLPSAPGALVVIVVTSGINFVVLRAWTFAGR